MEGAPGRDGVEEPVGGPVEGPLSPEHRRREGPREGFAFSLRGPRGQVNRSGAGAPPRERTCPGAGSIPVGGRPPGLPLPPPPSFSLK